MSVSLCTLSAGTRSRTGPHAIRRTTVRSFQLRPSEQFPLSSVDFLENQNCPVAPRSAPVGKSGKCGRIFYMALGEVWLSSCSFEQKYCLLTTKSIKKSCIELYKNPLQDGQMDGHDVDAKKFIFSFVKPPRIHFTFDRKHIACFKTQTVVLFNALMTGHSEPIHRLQSAINLSTSLKHPDTQSPSKVCSQHLTCPHHLNTRTLRAHPRSAVST